MESSSTTYKAARANAILIACKAQHAAKLLALHGGASHEMLHKYHKAAQDRAETISSQIQDNERTAIIYIADEEDIESKILVLEEERRLVESKRRSLNDRNDEALKALMEANEEQSRMSRQIEKDRIAYAEITELEHAIKDLEAQAGKETSQA